MKGNTRLFGYYETYGEFKLRKRREIKVLNRSQRNNMNSKRYRRKGARSHG